MWTLEKVNQYITDKVEENLYLDYKAAEALIKTEGKKNEISKDVSAFANSDGGVIIYGIKEYQKDTSFLPEKIDPVDRNEFSKETLEQIINTRISPKIHGIIITPLIVDQKRINEVIYIVQIPKSFTAHQAGDKRYYRRYNFQSIIMDDWEIKDIINRQQRTNAIVRLRPRFNKKFLLDFHPRNGHQLAFDIIATNLGNKAINLLDCMITGNEQAAAMVIPSPKFSGNYFELVYTNEVTHKATIDDNEFVVNIQRIPILPHTFKSIGQISIYSDLFIENIELKITVATEDNRWSDFFKGQELLE